MEEILGELRETDAALADADKAESDYLAPHRHLVVTEIIGGVMVTQVNRLTMRVEVEAARKKFSSLEAARNRLIEKRNQVLRAYAELKMAQQGVSHG